VARALVAPDDFKGTFTAPQVAGAIAAGLRVGGVEADELPIADGGDGTIDALRVSLGGELNTAFVEDPLGRPVDARWAMLADGETAVVEVAQASGLGRVSPEERDAWAASTRGTGQTGKAVSEVARRCRAANRPLHVVAGSIALAPAEIDALLLAGVAEATTLPELERAGRELALTMKEE
jgi:glycerate kinase